MRSVLSLLPLLAAAAFLGGCAASSVDQVVDAQHVGSKPHGGGASAATVTPGRADTTRTGNAASQPSTTGATRIAGAAGPRSSAAVTATPVVDSQDASVYRIGALDVLDVNVFMVPELTKAVQVSEAGTVNFPLIGETKVIGRTAREVEQMLTRQLGAKYLQDPQVSVTVKEFNSQRVTIEGSVKKPGVYALRDRTTLVQVIAIGGGLDELSDEQVTISRATGASRVTKTYDLAQIRTGAAPDPEIKPGDVLYVGKSAFKEALNNISKVSPIAGVLRPF